MADKQMSLEARREYLRRMRTRYRLASRSENGILLDEMARVTQMHRKSLIRLLNSPDLERQKRQRERGKTYGADVQHVFRSACGALTIPVRNGWSATQIGWPCWARGSGWSPMVVLVSWTASPSRFGSSIPITAASL